MSTIVGITPAANQSYTFDGAGTEANPYLIKTPLDLEWLATYVNTLNTSYTYCWKYYRLENNISLSAYGSSWNGGQGWISIGTFDTPFRGTFDGNSKTISGLFIKNGNNGLFGFTNGATIRNLGVIGVNITTDKGLVGGVVGQCCYSNIINTYTTGTVSGTSLVGGIVGNNVFSSVVMNCYSTANVTGSSSNVGGIAGGVGGDASVINCYATGIIRGYSWVAGIAGTADSIHNSVALNSIVSASTNAVNTCSGRICADNYTLSRNYGLSTMGVDGGRAFPTPATTYNLHDQVNGADITSAQSLTASFWTTSTTKWTAFDTKIWNIVNGQLPTLKAVETTPTANIDYVNEKLIGLANGSYTFNGTAYTVSNGSYTISQSWFGSTISIIKKGSGTTADSAALSLNIPARPSAPSVNGMNETVAGAKDGKITNVKTSMEYKYSTNTVWTACSSTEITGLAPGTYHVRLKAVADTSFSSAIAVVTILEGKAAEATPKASIDYVNEKLIGLANGSHTFNGAAFSVSDGSYNISQSWFGTTLTIIKKGSSTTVDSTAQSLKIPARPSAPSVNGMNETIAGANDGKITNVTASMEYKDAANTVWTACGSTEITGLAPGTYHVRLKAVADTSFSSAVAVVTILEGNAPIEPDYNGWEEIDGKWYYFDKNGVQQTGWLDYEGKRYYLNPYMIAAATIEIDGKMHQFNERGEWVGALDGWKEIVNYGWCYYDDGVQRIGWLDYEGKRYYLNPYMVTSATIEIDGKMHQFNERGEWVGALDGWKEIVNYGWCYYDDGVQRTGWLDYEEKRYYLNPYMVTSATIEIDGIEYRFNERGELVE